MRVLAACVRFILTFVCMMYEIDMWDGTNFL